MVVAEGCCGDAMTTAEGPNTDFCTIEVKALRTPVQVRAGPPERHYVVRVHGVR